MDAGARGRRLLQRREYRAKVSDFIPKELEDHVVYENPDTNMFPAGTQEKVKKVLDRGTKFMKQNPVGKVLGKVFGSSRPGSNYTPSGKVTAEANSAQMKAMHDAQMKKKEDDKVAAKKKDVKEGSVYGITRGSGKPSGAFKDYLDKKKKEKKKVDEACWKGYEKKGMKTMFGKRYPNCVKKTKKEEVELEAKKSCGEGEYYCYDEQKCKPIPDGMKVGKDGMLVKEDMKGMSQKSGDKRSTESGAGMTAQGVAKYNRRTGGNLKTAVTTPPSKLKAGSKAAKRRKSFCARSKSWTGPRGKAARRRWNCSYEPELPMIIDEKKKLFNSAPLSDRVSAWSKKITEGDTYVKSNRNRLTGLPNLGKGDKKTPEKKITGVNYGAMAQSYEPQGELVEMGRKGKGAINPDVLKNNPNLDPLKPGDYIKLKRLTAKVDKINEGALSTGAALTAAGLAAWKFAQGMNTRNKMKKSIETPGTNLNNIKNATDQKTKLMQQLNQSHEPEGEMTEAKVDKGKSDYAKQNERNQRTFGNRRGSRGSLASHDDTEARRYNTKKGRGVKMKGKKDKTPVNYHKKDSQARVDALLKSMKEDFYRKKYDVKDGGYKKTNKMTKSNKRAGDSKAQNREVHLDLRKYKLKKLKTEGSLHKWFKGSKSKDGKPGWVNVVTGGTCASDKPGEGTPKCVSSSKRASMSKAERLSASRRKKKADPGQQSKSGAAKPTYVATDKKKKKVDENAGPSTPVTRVGGGFLPNLGAGRLNDKKIRLKINPLAGLPKV